jgi:hypothetical protein
LGSSVSVLFFAIKRQDFEKKEKTQKKKRKKNGTREIDQKTNKKMTKK